MKRKVEKSNIYVEKSMRDVIPLIIDGEPVPQKHIDELQSLIDKRDDKISAWQTIWLILLQSPKIVKLTYYILVFLWRFKDMAANTDKSTTLAATVKVIMRIIAVILGFFSITVPESINIAIPAIVLGIAEVFSWLQGFWTNKDAQKKE